MQMLKQLWRASAPLTTTAGLMLTWLFAAAVGLALDDRLITNAPAWLKPAKFALSVAIYTGTLAWVFTYLPEWGRTRRIVGWTTAVVMVLELGIISVQAWRGVPSHFNVSSLLDGLLFTVMGMAIVIQTVSSIAVALAAWRQRFDDVALGWAIRLGLTMTIVGAFAGGLMTRPTAMQLEEARGGKPMLAAGAHTVGAPDGGPGLPGTGWSMTHGDLRVAHFVGLHAMQALPLVALLGLRVRLRQSTRTRLVASAAVSYGALFVVVLTQAFRGYSVLAPETLFLLGGWAAATADCSWVRREPISMIGRPPAATTIRAAAEAIAQSWFRIESTSVSSATASANVPLTVRIGESGKYNSPSG